MQLSRRTAKLTACVGKGPDDKITRILLAANTWPIQRAAWRESRKIALEILSGATKDPTRGALWYHATYAQPEWQAKLVKDRQIGRHVFYHRP